MSNTENNIFTNKTNIEYPSLDETADIRIINNNIKILSESKANIDNLNNIARETSSNNIENIVTQNKEDINNIKENLNDVSQKISQVNSSITNLSNDVKLSGVNFNSFIIDMALKGKVFYLQPNIDDTVKIRVTFPNHTRVVLHNLCGYVNCFGGSDTNNALLYYRKNEGSFLFYRMLYLFSGNTSYVYEKLRSFFIDDKATLTEYPIQVVKANTAETRTLTKSQYMLFILDNPDDVSKIKVTASITSNNSIITLTGMVTLRQMTYLTTDETNNACSWLYTNIKVF